MRNLLLAVVVVFALGAQPFALAKSSKAVSSSSILSDHAEAQRLLDIINSPTKGKFSLKKDAVMLSSKHKVKSVIIIACQGQECDNGGKKNFDDVNSAI